MSSLRESTCRALRRCKTSNVGLLASLITMLRGVPSDGLPAFGYGENVSLLEPENMGIRPDKLADYWEIVRAIPAGRKLEAVFELSDLARRLLVEGIRILNPGMSDAEAVRVLASLRLSDELWQKVYGSARETDKE